MSTQNPAGQSSIWLEVANVRLENNSVQIQVKGDRTDREPVWWNMGLKDEDHKATYRAITEGLDKKRIVIANLKAINNELKCQLIRIQYTESNSR